jgi:hypothetical protein
VRARAKAALLSALQLGYPSFPCNIKKRPTCKGGFHRAVPPSAVLSALWDEFPGELIGIPTGVPSGIAVLDIDARNGGAGWYQENRERLPLTRAHRTHSGGIHLLYRHLPGLRISESKIAPGIDVRAEGGYFIWWPAEGFDVRDAPVAEWPSWLEWLIGEPQGQAPRATAGRGGAADPFAAAGSFSLSAMDGLIQTVATAPEGQRNTVTYWAACRMRERIAEGQIAEDLARDIILEAAHVAGLPRWEAARTFESAMVRASS